MVISFSLTFCQNAPMVTMEAVAIIDVRVPMTVHVMQLLGSVSAQLDLLDQDVKLVRKS